MAPKKPQTTAGPIRRSSRIGRKYSSEKPPPRAAATATQENFSVGGRASTTQPAEGLGSIPPPPPTIPTDEDYNLPSEERRAILRRLQENVGDVSPHFWAQCQLCDIKCLEAFVTISEINPDNVQLIDGQARMMMARCKFNRLGFLSLYCC